MAMLFFFSFLPFGFLKCSALIRFIRFHTLKEAIHSLGKIEETQSRRFGQFVIKLCPVSSLTYLGYDSIYWFQSLAPQVGSIQMINCVRVSSHTFAMILDVCFSREYIYPLNSMSFRHASCITPKISLKTCTPTLNFNSKNLMFRSLKVAHSKKMNPCFAMCGCIENLHHGYNEVMHGHSQ